jgi:hypothetical protein
MSGSRRVTTATKSLSASSTGNPWCEPRINVEMSIEPTSGRIDMMTNVRSYSGNTLFDVSYIGSSNGDVTWTVQRVTKTSWDPSKSGVPSGSGFRPFIGDDDGIVSTPTTVGMTWNRPGNTYGALPTNLEVHVASVTPLRAATRCHRYQRTCARRSVHTRRIEVCGRFR